jgi:hypothetical protein
MPATLGQVAGKLAREFTDQVDIVAFEKQHQIAGHVNLFDSLELVSGPQKNTLILRSTRGFVTPHLGLHYSYNTEISRAWETFFPISVENVSLLRRVILESWLLAQSEDVISKFRIAVAPGFKLNFGPYKLDLRDHEFPIAEVAQGIQINIVDKEARRTIFLEKYSLPNRHVASRPKKIWIRPLGNAGNRGLQYLAAQGIKALALDVTIENNNLQEWGLSERHPEPKLDSRTAQTGREHFWIDVKGLAGAFNSELIDTVILDSFAFNISCFPPREKCRALFPVTPNGKEADGFGHTKLVCSVRAGDVLWGAHPDYIVLPPEYYKILQDKTGLDLVFYGQLGDDQYSKTLRSAFPDAQFVPGTSPQYDFDMLRNSIHLAPSISTFAWLAAWLSKANTIYLPVGGMFNPIQHPNQLYLPTTDTTFKYVLLPYCKSVSLYQNPERFDLQQKFLARYARFAGADEVSDICQRASAFAPKRAVLGRFDVKSYLVQNPDIVDSVCLGDLCAVEHYLRVGYKRTGRPFSFDPDAYLDSHPDVAMEIARGFYSSPLEHFKAVGWFDRSA